MLLAQVRLNLLAETFDIPSEYFEVPRDVIEIQ